MNMEFIEGDFNRIAAELTSAYDAISCNYWLEHSYDPDNLLRILAGLLKPEGVLVAGMPLDGSSDNAFSGEIKILASHPDQFHSIDMNFIGPGHQWKTNPADLTSTLLNSGFRKVKICQRAYHLSRFVCGSKNIYDRNRRRSKLLDDIFIAPGRTLVKLVFPKEPPYLARKF